MAIENANLNTLYVGMTNPPTTKVLAKKMTKIDGPKQTTDDTTTDDSAAEEHASVYVGNMKGLGVNQLVNTTDPSYQLLDQRSKDGQLFFCQWRPDGDGSGTKTQGIFQATVDASPDRDSVKKARINWDIQASGATTWTTQP